MGGGNNGSYTPIGVYDRSTGAYSMAQSNNLDRTGLALLATNLIPEANSPSGCNTTVVAKTSDPTTWNCFNYTLSPPTNWREELFRIDRQVNDKVQASFRYIHDAWNTQVQTPQWGAIINSFPTVENQFNGPGLNMIFRTTAAITPSLLNEFVISYTNSTIHLTDIPGPFVSTLARAREHRRCACSLQQSRARRSLSSAPSARSSRTASAARFPAWSSAAATPSTAARVSPSMKATCRGSTRTRYTCSPTTSLR